MDKLEKKIVIPILLRKSTFKILALYLGENTNLWHWKQLFMRQTTLYFQINSRDSTFEMNFKNCVKEVILSC